MRAFRMRSSRPKPWRARVFADARRLPGALVLAVSAAFAQGVGHPLDRPSVASPHAASAVLLDVAYAGRRIVVVGERGIVLLSDDGGISWRQAEVPVSVSLTKVTFATQRLGWAVGHYGVVLHSSDGGETWQRQLDGRAAAKLDKRAAHVADKPFLDVHFTDERNGFAVGAYNLAYRTRDGGRTWEYWSHRIDNPQSLHLYVVGAAGRFLYLAGEQGLFLRSTDGGDTFIRLPTPVKASYFTSAATASGSIVIAGLRGHAERTTDGGDTWTTIDVVDRASFLAAATWRGTRLLLGNQAGELFTSSDDGHTLKKVSAPPVRELTAIAVDDQGRVVATSLRGVTHMLLPP